MSMPTIGEQRFQAQLIHALNEIADSIQENTKATRELAAAIRESPANVLAGNELTRQLSLQGLHELKDRVDAERARQHEDYARARRPAPPSPPPGEPGE